MSRPVISVENLSKAYRIGLKEEVPDTLTSALIGMAKAPFRKFQELRRLDTFRDNAAATDTHWALKDVSFDVQEGEVLGVIGRNGAGKSTLLKILSRITEPTSGRAVIRGRVSSLLEVGTGFHPELSGRENIYLNGTILGMTKAEIDKKFDEIIDFSGIEKFLDTPIKRYSSGMKVRLAFAVAAHLEPEILIIDEVLAVGDAEFQKKCMGKMQDVARGGRTVLFVSHNMAAIQGLCSDGLLLTSGECSYDGDINSTIDAYMSTLDERTFGTTAGRIDLTSRINAYGDGKQIIEWLELLDERGHRSATFYTSRPLTLRIGVRDYNLLTNAQLGVMITTRTGEWIAAINTGMQPPFVLSRGHSEVVTLTIPQLPFVPGSYSIDVSVAHRSSGRYDYVQRAATVDVREYDVYGSGYSLTANDGVVYLNATWTVEADAPNLPT